MGTRLPSVSAAALLDHASYRPEVHPYGEAEARYGCHRVAEPGRYNHVLAVGSYKVDILAVDYRGVYSPTVIAIAAVVLLVSHSRTPNQSIVPMIGSDRCVLFISRGQGRGLAVMLVETTLVSLNGYLDFRHGRDTDAKECMRSRHTIPTLQLFVTRPQFRGRRAV